MYPPDYRCSIYESLKRREAWQRAKLLPRYEDVKGEASTEVTVPPIHSLQKHTEFGYKESWCNRDANMLMSRLVRYSILISNSKIPDFFQKMVEIWLPTACVIVFLLLVFDIKTNFIQSFQHLLFNIYHSSSCLIPPLLMKKKVNWASHNQRKTE